MEAFVIYLRGVETPRLLKHAIGQREAAGRKAYAVYGTDNIESMDHVEFDPTDETIVTRCVVSWLP